MGCHATSASIRCSTVRPVSLRPLVITSAQPGASQADTTRPSLDAVEIAPSSGSTGSTSAPLRGARPHLASRNRLLLPRDDTV